MALLLGFCRELNPIIGGNRPRRIARSRTSASSNRQGFVAVSLNQQRAMAIPSRYSGD